MIRLVWINKETKAWGSTKWVDYYPDIYIDMIDDIVYLDESLPQYEYYIEEKK